MTLRKVAAFDIDGTLYRWQLLHDLTVELAHRNLISDYDFSRCEDAFNSWRARHHHWDVAENIMIEILTQSFLKIPSHDLSRIASDIVSPAKNKIYSYTTNLLTKLQSEGYYTIAISGSIQDMANIFADIYNFDDCIGTLLESDSSGMHTGAELRTVAGRKGTILKEYIRGRKDLTLEGSIGVGDSGGDIQLLKTVTNPVAFNPSDDMLPVAISNGWMIVIERKNIAYTLKKDLDGTYILAQTDIF